ncbi:putative beta-lysine N-acetyltransferase [Eubacteriaceae bacterium ES3]|nr:putative beta-lysine N-acetyltransferase [Eubacteriaceae bacterium ES3]
MSQDQITQKENIVYQHGKANDRIYIMEVNPFSKELDIDGLEKIAQQKGYTKIIGKIPRSLSNAFESHQFEREALVPNFYKNDEYCFFMSKYFSKSRKNDPQQEEIDAIILQARAKIMDRSSIQNEYAVKKLNTSHVSDMVRLYKKVFDSYPFPIFDPEYLLSTFDEVFYFGFFDQDKLIACASCETDFKNGNAEMTDFAVLPEYRGANLAVKLLIEMEAFMRKKEIYTLYTIARATSPSMNCSFGKMGYIYGGTLYNNTQIAGSIESMNVWYKNIY